MVSALEALKIWHLALIAVAVAAGAAVVYQVYFRDGNPVSADQQLVPVQTGDLLNQVSISGSVVFPNRASQGFGIQGTVGEILVREGDVVDAGQPLARIDSVTITTLERAVAQAEINLRTANRALATARSSGVLSALNDAESTLAAARQEWAVGVADAEAEADTAMAAYQNVVTKWLGMVVDPDQLEVPPLAYLASNGIDLDEVFDPYQTPGRTIFGPSMPADDPGTPWNEQVVYIWLNLNPGNVTGTCPSGNSPGSGWACVQAELEDSWGAMNAASNTLDTVKSQANAAIAAAEKALADAQDAVDLEPLEVLLSEADVTLAQASLQDAIGRLEAATMSALISGVVTAVNAATGDSVAANAPVVEIVDLSVAEVHGNIDEIDVLFVSVGARTTITMDALGDGALQGAVTYIAPTATNQQGVVRYPVQVRIQVPPFLTLRDGLTAVARITLGEERDVLLIPLRAVYGTFDQPVVRVSNGSRVEEREVSLGTDDGFWVAVHSGLSEGEQVVVEGNATTAGTINTGGRFQQAPQIIQIPGGQGQRGEFQQPSPEQIEELRRQFEQGGGLGGGQRGGFGGGQGGFGGGAGGGQ